MQPLEVKITIDPETGEWKINSTALIGMTAKEIETLLAGFASFANGDPSSVVIEKHVHTHATAHAHDHALS